MAAARPKEAIETGAETLTPAEFDALVPGFRGTKTLVVDPAMAEHILGYNTANRRLSATRVSLIADQMKSGEFENTGEPIIVSREGVLNDGQHRLAAVAESGTTQELDVRFGIPRSAFTKTDTGKGRTGGDVLQIAGAAHGGAVAQAVRLLILYERGLPDSVREFVSNSQVAAAFEKWPDVADAVDMLSGRAFPKGVKSAPLVCTVFLANRAPGKRKLDAWLETLETGVGEGKTDPAHVLREYLIRGADAPSGTREAMLERWATMLKSWALYRSGETTTAKELKWRSDKGLEFPVLKDAKL